MNDWWRFVMEVTDHATQTSIAEKSGIKQPLLSDWKTGRIKQPDPSSIVTLTTAYGVPYTDGLVAAGHMTEDQAATVIERSPRSLTNSQLLSEIAWRIRSFDDSQVPPLADADRLRKHFGLDTHVQQGDHGGKHVS
ncbi:MAG: hypothetical protein A4E20_11075 [Nitrospira sp. SG-bin2]|uniref:helix-turn-helix domain-containing protein n=1 Tax=Nitrospira cf. moscoviensis SBR1015 TaxID=96242 RepID=UPI000A0D58D3|nr:helix-turn-helix transcriptional regulator [Nitrospira cf. moscoviensis SBR1015]OQW34554.1 MAG: hypothetical protein A4E20_11075 [Nitrospira sp. SG-bin2]